MLFEILFQFQDIEDVIDYAHSLTVKVIGDSWYGFSVGNGAYGHFVINFVRTRQIVLFVTYPE
jgi:negative regulator of genetic competence, sporulation and motility